MPRVMSQTRREQGFVGSCGGTTALALGTLYPFPKSIFQGQCRLNDFRALLERRWKDFMPQMIKSRGRCLASLDSGLSLVKQDLLAL